MIVQDDLKLEFRPVLSHEFGILDGISGTGKSMLSPFISALPNVTRIAIDETLEQLLVMRHLGLIHEDVLRHLWTLRLDLRAFNSQIGRETNLRLGDDTGLRFYRHKLKEYWKTLKSYDTGQVEEFIKSNRVTSSLMLHHSAHALPDLFKLFGRKLKVVEVVRHPVYLVDHWQGYYGRSSEIRSTDWDLRARVHPGFPNFNLPWWASTETYHATNKFDLICSLLMDALDKFVEPLDRLMSIFDSEQLLVVPFESFVAEPDPWLIRLQTLFGAELRDRDLIRLKRSQKIPRNRVTQGIGHASYGFENVSDPRQSQAEDFRRRFDEIARSLSAPLADRFVAHCQQYEASWLSTDFSSRS
jgi:hypothetical protein